MVPSAVDNNQIVGVTKLRQPVLRLGYVVFVVNTNQLDIGTCCNAQQFVVFTLTGRAPRCPNIDQCGTAH